MSTQLHSNIAPTVREGFALGAVVAAEWIGSGEVKGLVEMESFMRHLVTDGKLLDVL